MPGAPGLPGANGVSGYQIKAADTALFNAGRNVDLPQIVIPCDAGKVPVAGGHEMLTESAHKLSVLTSVPVDDDDFKGWRLIVKNSHAPSVVVGAQVRIFVVCAQMAQ